MRPTCSLSGILHREKTRGSMLPCIPMRRWTKFWKMHLLLLTNNPESKNTPNLKVKLKKTCRSFSCIALISYMQSQAAYKGFLLTASSLRQIVFQMFIRGIPKQKMFGKYFPNSLFRRGKLTKKIKNDEKNKIILQRNQR